MNIIATRIRVVRSKRCFVLIEPMKSKEGMITRVSLSGMRFEQSLGITVCGTRCGSQFDPRLNQIRYPEGIARSRTAALNVLAEQSVRLADWARGLVDRCGMSEAQIGELHQFGWNRKTR